MDWNLLLIDDDEDDFIITREMIGRIPRSSHILTWEKDIEKAPDTLLSDSWDAVLVDYDMGASHGIDLIKNASVELPQMPFIMITGRGSYDMDLEAMEAGASDYISKNMLNPPFIERVIRYAIERKNREAKLENLVRKRTHELRNAMEELLVYEEELRGQNDELEKSYQDLEKTNLIYYERLAAFPSGFFVTDDVGFILEADKGASLMLHERQENLVGKPLVSFIYAAERSHFTRQFDNMKDQQHFSTWANSIYLSGSNFVKGCISVKPVHHNGDQPKPTYQWFIHLVEF